MLIDRKCSECGAAIPPGSTDGLCAQCLFSLGLDASQSPMPALPQPERSSETGSTRERGSPKSGAVSTARLTEKSGDRIGRYRLLQEIGHGGCGVVYMAEQQDPVRRRVAFKVIKLGMDTRHHIARFEAEGQALALMDHPNIARVFDAGATDAGRPYLVMELVRGIPITTYCDEHQLSMRERLELFIRVCQAIQHAHQKGIIHRDLKPSNILVTVNDGIPMPKIIDFGIAKAIAHRLTDKTLFTEFHALLGTPAYMSPEQAELSSVDIDTRSDSYSLGVLLYELLTGQTPFDAKELVAAGFDQMRRTIREKEPPRPSTRLRTLQPAERTTTAQRRKTDPPRLVNLLSGDLDWIVMKALEKDRSRRYETANGLASDIQRHLDNEPVLARPPSKMYRLHKLVRRNKTSAVAAAVMLLALLIALGSSTWALARESVARQRATTEAARSRQVAEFLKEMISAVDPSLARGGDTTILRAILDQAAERVATELKNDAAVQADLYATLAESYKCFYESSKAEAMSRLALRLTQDVYGPYHTNTAGAMRRLAANIGPTSDWETPQLEQAEKLLDQALAIYRSTFGDVHPSVADIYQAQSFFYRERKDWSTAGSLLTQAMSILRKFHGGETEESVSLLYTLGNLAEDRGDLAEAERIQRECLDLNRRLLGETHLGTIESITMVADLVRRRGDLIEAEALHRHAVSLRRKHYGADHVRMPWALYLLAGILEERGQLSEAEAVAREGLQLARQRFGADSPGTDWNREILAWILIDQGKWSEAEALAREELANARKRSATNSSNLVEPLEILGESLHRQGKFAEAETVWRETIEKVRSRHPATNDHFAGATACLGQLLADWVWSEWEQNGLLANNTPEDPMVLARVVSRAREAEALLRHSLEVRSRSLSNDWRVANTASRSGFASVVLAGVEPVLTPEARIDILTQAEAMLLPANQALCESSRTKSRFKRDALERLVYLYKLWHQFAPDTGKEEQEAEWRQRLLHFDSNRPTMTLPWGSYSNEY